jgi:hypothetical protein
MHVRGCVVSELRSVIEGFRAESVSELPDARVEEDFAELQRAVELLDAERLRRLAEIDRRRLYERDGHLSAASWLAAAHHMAWGHAREHVRVARAVGDMPRTVRAFDAGDISMSAVRILATAHDVHPQAFARSEAELVDAARLHSVADLHRVIAVWRDHAERDGAGGDATYERRRLHASRSLGGMVRIDGDLDPETGDTVLTALHAMLDADARSRGRDDGRSPAQRRADGLGEICRQWLDRSARPVVAGERPHLTLTIAARELRRGSDATGELDHAGPVPAATARRLACDASLMRVVLSARSEPLDVGRRTSVVPPSLRRAVVVRDGGCRFPGCDRPPPWCDAHHVDHWADGGATSLANLLLLCRRHHRLVHRPGGFGLRLVGGLPVFRRSDGSVLEGRGPP